jgi:PIN domain nuclease of toxin-antitoxin system
VRFLLDTHVLLWALAEPGRIPAGAREWIESSEHQVFFSAASIWEIAIKVRLGRLDLSLSPGEVTAAAVRTGFEELPVRASHAAATATLPMHHTDPFDRLLVAQALHEPARLLTADLGLRRYSDLVEVLV